MAKNHPKGLVVLALANMGERFGYYTMLAILTLYLQAKFGFSSAATSMIYGTFLGLIYLLPVIGGIVADKWLGYGKTILIGISIMFGGYFLLGLPLGNEGLGVAVMAISLLLISAGTGFFKGNVQALVGKLYDNPMYSKGRDMAFSIFYMFINIGAFFAPSMGNYITKEILGEKGFTYNASIPANFVKLNNETVDEKAFLAELEKEHEDWATLSSEEQTEIINKAKDKAGVMFPADEAEVLFNLKLYGLNQYTNKENKAIEIAVKEGKVIERKLSSECRVTNKDLELYTSRNPQDKEAKAALRLRVENAVVPIGLALEDGQKSQGFGFARDFGKAYVAETLSVSYSWAFFVACISLVISILIFVLFRKTWKSADVTARQSKEEKEQSGSTVVEMSKEEVRERLLALGLVFVVVIFFWMAFHQNGLTMTLFARDYTASKVDAMGSLPFSLLILVPFICFMYGVYLSTFGLLGGKKNPKVGFLLMGLGIAGIAGGYLLDIQPIIDHKGEFVDGVKSITPQIFQQFNPFFIILLTPLTLGFFGYLANKDKEPSAPRKIGFGMLLAAAGFSVLLIGSLGLPAPSTLDGAYQDPVSPNILIGTYLVLTFAELFLSPMGLSFVSKVSPPQYAGLMQGGWLAATAVGNLLVGVMGTFWDKLPLTAFWGILITCCLLSAAFIFSIMKRLEKVTE